MANLAFNGQPVLALNLQLPLSGAWSAELQVASDDVPETGASVTLTVCELSFTGRVVRAGAFAERVSVRLTGGSVDWNATVQPQHYRNATVDSILSDLGLTLDQSNTTQLAFWTRTGGFVGQAMKELAAQLGFNWRINPDGTLRMRAEAPSAVDPDVVETARDEARGIVTVAPDQVAGIVPGVTFGADSVGDVLYEMDEGHPLRCRYWTEGRGAIRSALERAVRWIMRDTLYLGTYTAKVERQASDGTLDLTPTDARLRAAGLQAVPIRHGLPGCRVEVPVGELVLLSFDGGDPRQPYAALWHEGQVTAVYVGGERAVAMADLTKERIDTLQAAFDAHIHPTGVGPSGPPQEPIGALEGVESDVLHSR